MATRRRFTRREIETALKQHQVNGLIREWQRRDNHPGYAIKMPNGQIELLNTLAETSAFCWGLESANQAWREALGNRHGVKSPASADFGQEMQQMGKELGEAMLAPDLETICARLQDWSEKEALGFVVPTNPIGQEWVIGLPSGREAGQWELTKFGHDPQSCVETGLALLAGLGAGALWAAREAFRQLEGKDPLDDPSIRAMFGQEQL